MRTGLHRPKMPRGVAISMKLQSLFRRTRREWNGWPEQAYQKAHYRLRLEMVQQHLTECLDAAPSGSVRIISMCAGDGRDVIGAVQSHARRRDVIAWLVELDQHSVAAGVRNAKIAGLDGTVNFRNEDATDYASYPFAPADILLVCGVWGHVPVCERDLLIRALTRLCKPGGMVVWTRGVSKRPDRVHEIEAHFANSEWEQCRHSFTADQKWAVVSQRYCGPLRELPASGKFFHFQHQSGR